MPSEPTEGVSSASGVPSAPEPGDDPQPRLLPGYQGRRLRTFFRSSEKIDSIAALSSRHRRAAPSALQPVAVEGVNDGTGSGLSATVA